MIMYVCVVWENMYWCVCLCVRASVYECVSGSFTHLHKYEVRKSQYTKCCFGVCREEAKLVH